MKKTYQNYNPSDLVEVADEEAGSEITEFYEYTTDGRVIYNESTEENNTTKTTYIWANTTLWCEVNAGVVYYHHTDHLGTTEVITDESGTVVWEAGYEAFGSVLNERGDSTFTPSYTGKFFDKASGLYYFNARWYDSELGKFTSQDPIRDGLNWWNYCNGNPISFIDWMGLEAEGTTNDNLPDNTLQPSGYYTDPNCIEAKNTDDIVRKIIETNLVPVIINEVLDNTNIKFNIAIGKQVFGNKTKIDISLYSENSVSNDPSDNCGILSEKAFSSSLSVTVKNELAKQSATELANADSSNCISLYIETGNSSIHIDIDIYVVAPYQKHKEQNYYYEVILK